MFKSSPSDPGTVYERQLPRVDCGRSSSGAGPVFFTVTGDPEQCGKEQDTDQDAVIGGSLLKEGVGF